MELINLLQNRRSRRKFTEKRIESGKIDMLIKAALMSPTGKSRNHWDFIVVEDKLTLVELSKCKPHGASLIAGAPMAIVVIGNPSISDTWVEDCSIASIIIQLEAEDLGLGSCWVQVRNREHDENSTADMYIKKLLEIPEEKSVLSIIAIGYPIEIKNPFNMTEQLSAKIHRGKY